MPRRTFWILLPVGVAILGVSFWSARLRSQTVNPIAMPQTAGFVIGFGLTDKTPTAWDGSIAIADTSATPSSIADIEGWRFSGDTTDHRSTWKLSTHLAPGIPPTPPGFVSENGVIVSVRESSAAYELQVKTARGNFSFRGADVPYGVVASFLSGAATVRRVPGTLQLSKSQDEQDMPAMAQGRGTNADDVWLSYIAFVHGKGRHAMPQFVNEPVALSSLKTPAGGDQVFLMHFSKSTRVWTGPFAVSPAGQDVFRTAVAVDGAGTVWVFWSANRNGNFDIHASAYSHGRFSPEILVTSDPGTDLSPVAATDALGRVWVAWQGFRKGNLEVLAAVQQGAGFSDEKIVSVSPASDWEPAIAADSRGDIAISWDTYDKGDYDVYYRRLRAGGDGIQMDAAVAVANSRAFEARSSIAFDPQDRLWVAYETSSRRWGKNFGADETTGTALYVGKNVAVRVFDGGGMFATSAELAMVLPTSPGLSPLAAPKPPAMPLEPAPDPALVGTRPAGDSVPLPDSARNSGPALSIGPDGMVYLAYREPSGVSYSPAAYVGHVWLQAVVYFDGTKWSQPVLLANSDGRLDYRPALTPLGAGELLIASASDHRLSPMPGQTLAQGDGVNTDIFAMDLKVGSAASRVVLKPASLIDSMAEPDASVEASQVTNLRAAGTTANGRDLKLMRGEFHRHTEISFDGGRDGTLADAYRYLIDAASLDWAGCCDHDNGAGREYNWWLEQKYNDAFKLGGQFVPMFSYERSIEYPEGHRNILFAQRGVRPLPRLPRSAALSSAPAPDTLMLYSYLKVFKGLSAPHTSATSFGTDWRNNDPSVETAVEIYQGHRQNYEMPGAPRAVSAGDAIGGYEPSGFVSEALKKGFRLGFEASSDHISTHIAFCNLWVEEPTRQAILNAFRRRHMYGATDNILADVRCGNHFMGDEFATSNPPSISVKLHGTGDFGKVVIVKDGAIVYSASPGSPDVDFTWTDLAAEKNKTSYYYVRGEQVSGDLVWASPMWIRYQ